MQSTKSTQSSKLVKMIILALLGTISFVLFFLNFPLPFLPPYLKIDFSEIPALIAAFIFSPIAGIAVIAIKNVLYLIIGGGEPIGVTANFIAGLMFILPVAILYHKYKGVKSIISGIVTGTAIMAVGMTVLNYFLVLPAYGWFMGWDMSEQVKWVSVIAGVLPFNIIKGIVIGLLFVPLFIKMQDWIEKKQVDLV